MTTELEAVNRILSSIGEAPVNSITATTLPPDVQYAVDALEEANREIQSEGWHFNTTVQTLIPNVSNNIVVPANTLLIDTAKDEYQDIDPIDQNGTLFDIKGNTSTFTQKVKCEIVTKKPWEQIPEQCKAYITAKASRRFQMRSMGSQLLNQELLRDEITSKAKFLDYDSRNADRSIFDDNSVFKVINR